MRGAALALGFVVASAPSPPQDGRCSLNGRLVGNSCACSAAWIGEQCELLDLLPTPAGADYDVRQATGLSTWGASIVQVKDLSWHMYLSEFKEGCGEREFHPAASESARWVHRQGCQPQRRRPPPHYLSCVAHPYMCVAHPHLSSLPLPQVSPPGRPTPRSSTRSGRPLSARGSGRGWRFIRGTTAGPWPWRPTA